MMTDLSPIEILMRMHERDPLAAIRLANTWGSELTSERADAAWELMRIQTEIPSCGYCGWALLPDEPHPYCDEQLTDARLLAEHSAEASAEGYPPDEIDLPDEHDPRDDEDVYDPYEVIEDPLA